MTGQRSPLALAPVLFLLSLLATSSLAQEKHKAPDRWLTNASIYPGVVSNSTVTPAAFATLHAETLAGQLRVSVAAQALGTNSPPTLHFSADEPGHWPARDWRSLPMTRRGQTWDASLPVDDVDVPLVYFVQAATPAPKDHLSLPSGALSPMRVCFPRATGLEIPSRIFWPFLDGFEAGLDGWRHLAPALGTPPLRTDALAKSGHAALAVLLPAGQNSVTIATTRLRGWHLTQQSATGLRLWMLTREGTGKARLSLLANALTTNQVISVCTIEPALTDQWQRIDIPFSSFAKLPFHSVDLLTIEFIGAGPREFLVDDVQLLGRWKVP